MSGFDVAELAAYELSAVRLAAASSHRCVAASLLSTCKDLKRGHLHTADLPLARALLVLDTADGPNCFLVGFVVSRRRPTAVAYPHARETDEKDAGA